MMNRTWMACALSLSVCAVSGLPVQAILPSVVDAPDEWLVPSPPEETSVVASPVNDISPATTTAPEPVITTVVKDDDAKQGVVSATVADGVSTPVAKTEISVPEADADVADHVQFQHMALYQELRDDDVEALADIGLLWQTAIERSGTIRFAIEKLSRKNAVGDDPNQESFAKSMVKNLARLGGVAGSMWTGTPAGLIGGDMVNDLVHDPNAGVGGLTQVTDADMVLLAKEVESLQAELIDTYYGYRHARERLSMAESARQDIMRYETVMNAADDKGGSGLGQLLGKRKSNAEWAMVQPLVSSVTTSLNDDVIKAQQELLSARQALVLLVGADAMTALEQLYSERDGNTVAGGSASSLSPQRAATAVN